MGQIALSIRTKKHYLNILSLSQPQSSFRDKEIVKCVERCVQRFDPKLSPIVFSRFEIDNALAKEDIVRFPELFTKTLQQIFRFGAKYLEKEILYELRKEFAFGESIPLSFAAAVHEIRQ
jgi:hypothetical protein